MDTLYYLDKFQKSVDQLNHKLFNQKQLDIKVGIWVNSAVLKIQKKTWIKEKPFEKGIFFSIWVNDQLIDHNRLYYNIHALKLREMKNYTIKSREFAGAFRSKFKPFEKQWPNVSVDFGPLTLMEGWVKIDINDFEYIVADLAHKLLAVDHIIDELLEERQKDYKSI